MTQLKSKKRVIDHGEVFTSEREVNAMLDLVKSETERVESRFLEPACGTGNFLIEILRRKLNVIQKRYQNKREYERYAVIAIASIYGIDILEDNVRYCRKRLLNYFNEQYTNLYGKNCRNECSNTVSFILELNIVWGDTLTMKTMDTKEPIVFSEWCHVNSSKLKRRDYIFEQLVNSKSMDGNVTHKHPNSEQNNSSVTPIKEFPSMHFLRLCENA